MVCQFCSRECKKGGLQNHVDYCRLNPERRSREGVNNPNYGNQGSNAAIKARETGVMFTVSEITRQRLSNAGRGHKWSAARKANHSVTMSQVAADNAASYSANNVVGRVHMIETVDGYGCLTKVRGSWEWKVAQWLNEHGVCWTNAIEERIMYQWEGVMKRYYPDFYLPDHEMYIEVKGYETERDRAKWSAVPNLLVIRKPEIADLNKALGLLSR